MMTPEEFQAQSFQADPESALIMQDFRIFRAQNVKMNDDGVHREESAALIMRAMTLTADGQPEGIGELTVLIGAENVGHMIMALVGITHTISSNEEDPGDFGAAVIMAFCRAVAIADHMMGGEAGGESYRWFHTHAMKCAELMIQRMNEQLGDDGSPDKAATGPEAAADGPAAAGEGQ